MSDARQSIQAAKELSAGADDTVNTNQNLDTAEDFLQKAQRALEQGDYSSAKHNAKQAKALAMGVQQELQSVIAP